MFVYLLFILNFPSQNHSFYHFFLFNNHSLMTHKKLICILKNLKNSILWPQHVPVFGFNHCFFSYLSSLIMLLFICHEMFRFIYHNFNWSLKTYKISFWNLIWVFKSKSKSVHKYKMLLFKSLSVPLYNEQNRPMLTFPQNT